MITMFKKLIDGELPLKDTFWKFGVLGLLAINLVTKIFGIMLARRLGGYSVLGYYTSNLHNFAIETATVVLTVLYLGSLSFLVFYSISMIFGVWRSSAEYNRSLWLRYISRILIIVLSIVTLRASF